MPSNSASTLIGFLFSAGIGAINSGGSYNGKAKNNQDR